jgi:predicted esterase
MRRMSVLPSRLFIALALCAGSACNRISSIGVGGSSPPRTSGPGQTRAARKPSLPLDLPPPPAPESTRAGQDLRRLKAAVLLREARQAASQGDYSSALRFQYWAVQATGAEQYDLACYQARLGRIDAAFYWLQLAGLEDGVHAEWADQDPDLERLRDDPRWPRVRRFLDECASGERLTELIIPSGYDGQAPLTTLVWLHGSNSHPGIERNGCMEDIQALADREHIAVLGVSGTIPLGKAKFHWSEDPERDYQRIAAALAEIADRVKVRRGSVIALGFSQGAQVGLEVAVRHPEMFAGAVAVAPGAAQGSLLRRVAPSPSLTNRGFVIIGGDEDHPSRVQTAEADVQWLRYSGAKVSARNYPNLGHEFPPDFSPRLAEWIRFVESARSN